jgi:MurNAc alpha-1-phosphate uridylyltransferase
MSGAPATAMVLAAGLGTRLRPITDRVPKPLVNVAGRTMIDRALDRLVAAGVRRAVVNLHYKADIIARHLSERRDIEIVFSPEETLLDTGGGVARALALLDERFFVANSDIIWRDGKDRALSRLLRAFDDRRHDALLLLQRTTSAVGYDGQGDFLLDQLGTLRRRREYEVAPHLFAGVQVVHRRLFDGAPAGAFSMNTLWDRAIAEGRCAGLVHDGDWFHVGTESGLAAAEAQLAPSRTAR